MKNKRNKLFIPKNFVLDVDGVFTDGKFYYTTEGKVMKIFGPDDHDALLLIREKLHIHAISGDKRGFPIVQKRIQEDMHISLDLVSTYERIDWIKKNFNPKETIYMGDGIFDPLVFEEVAYSIAPANAFLKTKKAAQYVTKAKGGEGAVAEAAIHILEKFFNEKFNLKTINFSKGSGAWGK